MVPPVSATWHDDLSMAAHGGSGQPFVPVNAGPAGSGHPRPSASDLPPAPARGRNGGAGTPWPTVAARLAIQVAALQRQLQRRAAALWDAECRIADLEQDLEIARSR